MKRERDPTSEEFEELLAWLDRERDGAGKKYEILRVRLLRIFISRGCLEAEGLADEVMNRVAVRIEKLKGTYEGDPAKCFQGFADKVHLEYLRELKSRSGVDPAPLPVFPDESEQEERQREEREEEDECLTRCLQELSGKDSDLFRRYFQEEKRARIVARKKLAVELQLSANALRIKAHRIRRRLWLCMTACLSEIRGTVKQFAAETHNN